MPKIEDATEALSRIEASVQKVLTNFGGITLAILFGSVVTGRQRTDSDLDIAVAMQHPLSADEKMALIQALAEVTGRPVDLIDLTTAPEPLLGQIVLHGRRILGNDTLFGNLISRHLIEQADFMPYRNRILSERRKAWLGK
ncbi:nucleotidyltransferase domain-containing protein [Methylicorpusculum sp.]|uniref:type VII toxin-antitoxin system MntA family adenylyltransferase antitoxin n=1 Tax=Methylicorpusculum sp. TaxID=2713644 RepID=UPI0027219231|nr:nucleotidyltransferase domain-containing protein [Methylicorpusculum sp.]MDO8845687.1 nucleotidyltransferase domain-containing protein [Methylicorpusculum sp.]